VHISKLFATPGVPTSYTACLLSNPLLAYHCGTPFYSCIYLPHLSCYILLMGSGCSYYGHILTPYIPHPHMEGLIHIPVLVSFSGEAEEEDTLLQHMWPGNKVMCLLARPTCKDGVETVCYIVPDPSRKYSIWRINIFFFPNSKNVRNGCFLCKRRLQLADHSRLAVGGQLLN